MADKIILLEVDVDTDAAVKDTIRLKEELEVLKAQAQAAREKHGELSAEYLKYQAAIKSTQADIKTQENLTQKLTGANAENAGTLTKLAAENAKLRQEQRGLNLETKEGVARNKEINAKINENTKFIKDNSDSLVQNKMNVGNYAGALKDMGVGQAGVVQGFLGMAKAAWAFIATPIGAIIAAIVLAITAVYNVFKKFEPVLEWFERKIAAVSAVLSVLKDVFLSVFTGTKSLTEAFDGVGGAMAQAAKEAEDLKRAQQELEDQQILMIETEAKQKRQIDELLLQSKDRTKSEKERIALIDEALKVEEDAYNKKKAIADAEYEQAVRQIAIDNQLTDEQEANLKEKGAAYLQSLQEIKGINDEEVKSFAEVSAKREQILNESITIREKAINRQNALIEKAAEAESKRLEKEKQEREKAEQERLDELKKREDAERKWAEFQIESAKVQEQARIDQANKRVLDERERRKEEKEMRRIAALEDMENEMQIRILQGESEFALQREQLAIIEEQEIAAAEKSGANVFLIQQKYSLARQELDKAEVNGKLALQASLAGNIAQLFGKQTGIGKIAAIAEATISGYLGVQNAFSAGAKYSLVLGYANAAIAGLVAAKNIKSIIAVKSGLPGDTAGGSSNINTSPGGANVNPSIGQGIVSRETTQTPNQVNVNTQPTLVIDKVTEAQQQQNRINQTQAI